MEKNYASRTGAALPHRSPLPHNVEHTKMALKSVCACWFLQSLTTDVVRVVVLEVVRRDDGIAVATRAARAGEI